jgi:hypothetical protein
MIEIMLKQPPLSLDHEKDAFFMYEKPSIKTKGGFFAYLEYNC